MLPGTFIFVSKIVIGALIFSVLLAALRNPFVRLVAAVADLLALPVRRFAPLLRDQDGPLHSALENTLDGLRYSPDDYVETERDTNVWSGWSVIGPLVYMIAFLFVALGDAYLLYLRFAALFQLPASQFLVGHLELLGSVLWIANIFVFGLVLFDLLGASPLRQPFGKMQGRTRRWMLIGSISGLWLAFVGTAMFYTWGQFQIFDKTSSHHGLALDFLVILSALLTGALIGAGWSLVVSLAALWALILLAARGVLRLATVFLRCAFWTLDTMVTLLDSAIRATAFPGLLLWNWLTSFERVRDRWHFNPIDWAPRPRLGIGFSPFDEVEEPATPPEAA